MPRNSLSAVFDLWFLWHETFLNSSSFLPLVVKHLFEYRAFRCGEYEYIPYAKKCQGYFSFFLDFFDFFYAALREPAGGCAAGSRDRVPAFTDSRVEPENDTIAKSGMTDGFDTGPSTRLRDRYAGVIQYSRKFLCQLLQIPNPHL